MQFSTPETMAACAERAVVSGCKQRAPGGLRRLTVGGPVVGAGVDVRPTCDTPDGNSVFAPSLQLSNLKSTGLITNLN